MVCAGHPETAETYKTQRQIQAFEAMNMSSSWCKISEENYTSETEEKLLHDIPHMKWYITHCGGTRTIQAFTNYRTKLYT
jgi:hypothetical protein